MGSEQGVDGSAALCHYCTPPFQLTSWRYP